MSPFTLKTQRSFSFKYRWPQQWVEEWSKCAHWWTLCPMTDKLQPSKNVWWRQIGTAPGQPFIRALQLLWCFFEKGKCISWRSILNIPQIHCGMFARKKDWRRVGAVAFDVFIVQLCYGLKYCKNNRHNECERWIKVKTFHIVCTL